MSIHVWQRSIVDEAGNIMPLASVEVRDQDTSNLVQLYDDYDGNTPLGNPITADADGFVRFYAATGRYRIQATSGAISRIWEDELLGTFSDAIEHKRTGAEISAGIVPSSLHYEPGNVLRYGAVADGVTDNRAAFIAAVEASPTNGSVYIPTAALPYLVDTSGGETTAVEIDKRITVVIDGDVKASTGAIQVNPPTIFLVSADNVTFTGSGKLMGAGTVNQVNTGTDATLPSLVKVTGDNFTMDGLTIDTPYKVGVFLHNNHNCKISNCNFTGGPTSYQDTGYFAIRVYQGSQHIISSNQFYPNASGGMYVQCIFSNASEHLCIYGNVAKLPYEKLAYVNGNYCSICGNVVVGNTGLIPGTNQKGTIGAAIRHDGLFGIVSNNLIYSCGGGVSAIGGGGLTIAENTMYLVGQSGVAVFGGSVAYDYLSIRNNILVCGALTGIVINDGILVSAPIGSNFYFDISHNQVVGFAPTDGIANLAAWSSLTVIPYYSTVKPTVSNNRVYSTVGGGTTGASEPTWPTTPGNTVVDGTVTWTCVAVDNTASAGIHVIAPGGGQLNERCLISYNNIAGGAQGCRVGIWTDYLSQSVISFNRLRTTVYGIREDNGSNNRFLYNSSDSGLGAAVAIQGLNAASFGEGNVYDTGKGLAFAQTLTASVATMNVTGLVAAANAKVFISPANDAAADYVFSHGLYATVSSPNVALTSGDGVNFVGTEVINVHIVQ